MNGETMNKYTKKDYEMFKLALTLAITAPTEEDSQKCIKIAEGISILFPETIIAKAKREVQLDINGGRT